MSPKPTKQAREQVTLEFPDNAALAALGGAHQKNLVRIEQKLGVRVAMRGNLLAIEGAAEARSGPTLHQRLSRALPAETMREPG